MVYKNGLLFLPNGLILRFTFIHRDVILAMDCEYYCVGVVPAGLFFCDSKVLATEILY